MTIIPMPQPESSLAGPQAPALSIPRVASREIAPAGDEAELTRRLAAGDPAALTAITEWLWEPLAAYAYRIVEDRDVARDIAQEACVRLWERRGVDAPRSVRPYLFRVVRNLALDHLKTGRSRRRVLKRQDPSRQRRPARPDEELERSLVAARVQECIHDLPDRRREVFVLAYLRGLSYAEIGEVLGISPKTVQNQMTSALAQLRTTLRPLIDERSASDRPFEGGRR
jgi:RNA polymerase sigma-70 factor, ECF subfamily